MAACPPGATSNRKPETVTGETPSPGPLSAGAAAGVRPGQRARPSGRPSVVRRTLVCVCLAGLSALSCAASEKVTEGATGSPTLEPTRTTDGSKPTPTPTPRPPPTASRVTLQAAITGGGVPGVVTASVTAGADCSAEADFKPPSPRASPVGQPTPIKLGGPASVDRSGSATWKLSWVVGMPRQTGTWAFVATCSLQGQTTRVTRDFQVS